MSVVREIADQAIIPVIRATDVQDAVATARAMARAGMGVIELTHSTPDVEQAVEALRDDGLVVGLGTIADAAQVATAVQAGARFVVSYACPAGFVEAARACDVLACPGIFTPHEAAVAATAGAELVKLFPARLAEPSYLGDLRAVLPQLRVMVSGGVRARAEELLPWLRAGALAVGMGGELGTVAAVGANEVERRVRAVLATRRLAERDCAALR